MLDIHDIKPLEKVPDYSIYLYYGGIAILIILALFLLYMVYSFFQKRKNSKERHYYAILKSTPSSNPKEWAYTISKYGFYLAKEQRQKDLLSELNLHLEQYKYKKQIPQGVDKKTQTLYETFVESLDV
jgi:hypothetical protein